MGLEGSIWGKSEVGEFGGREAVEAGGLVAGEGVRWAQGWGQADQVGRGEGGASSGRACECSHDSVVC